MVDYGAHSVAVTLEFVELSSRVRIPLGTQLKKIAN